MTTEQTQAQPKTRTSEVRSDALLDSWQVQFLRLAEECLRDGVRSYIADHDGQEGVDQLKYLLDETQWWDWLPTDESNKRITEMDCANTERKG